MMVTVSRMSGGAAGAAALTGVRAAGHGHVSPSVLSGLGRISTRADAGMTAVVGRDVSTVCWPSLRPGEKRALIGLLGDAGLVRPRRQMGSRRVTGLGSHTPGRVIGSLVRGVPGRACALAGQHGSCECSRGCA